MSLCLGRERYEAGSSWKPLAVGMPGFSAVPVLGLDSACEDFEWTTEKLDHICALVTSQPKRLP